MITDKGKNIHSFSDSIIHRKHKENLLSQCSVVIWMTGLSGAGKTTIGMGMEQELNRLGYLTQLLDGDNIRTGINSNLGFSIEDRIENIRRIAEVSKLFLHCGVITICCFISPTNEIRKIAKYIIGEENFIEIFINAPLSVCEERDVKGLYRKARAGLISDFTGIGSPFETPVNPDIEINTDRLTIDDSVKKAVQYILPRIQYRKE